MPCYLPKGTKLKIRIKIPCGTAYFKVYGAKDSYTSGSDYTWIATKYKSGSYYHDLCLTTNGEYNIIKILDKGGKPFYIDAISYDNSCTPTYLWSTGATSSSITVNPTSTTDYWVKVSCNGYSFRDTIGVTVNTCGPTECHREVSNTIGCANKPYVIWLKDKDGKGHHLKGDSTLYQWVEYSNGNVRFKAENISASGLDGTFDVDLLFSGRTSTAPVNSPKLSNCFTVTDYSDWEYFTTTSGTITSTDYGNITVSRKGPAFQLGDGANITQDGFGASGWFNIIGGNGHIVTGDVNLMLSDCSDSVPTRVVCVKDSLELCLEDEFDFDSLFSSSYTKVKAITGTTSNGTYSIENNLGSGTNCCSLYNVKPHALTFLYDIENISNHSQSTSSPRITTYYEPLGRDVLMVVNGKSSPTDTSSAFYRAELSAGDEFTVLRNSNNKWQSDLYFHIYNPAGDSLLQFVKIHVSCSQPLISGEQFGHVVLLSGVYNGNSCGASDECSSVLSYKPDLNFVGIDTIEFEVCMVENDAKVCKKFILVVETKDCGVVPVDWLTFDVEKFENNKAILNWSTAMELNNSHFEIERSTDGDKFVQVGPAIPGAGNSNQVLTYSQFDMDLPNGLIHYRIKQIDYDGQYDYSPVRSILVNGGNQFLIFPNPAAKTVNVHFELGSGQELSVKNISGQEMSRVRLSDQGDVRLDTENYPQGIYFLTVNGETRRLVIQH